MPEGDRYIEIPALKLLAELRAIGKAIIEKGGNANEGRAKHEIYFDFTPPDRPARVRVYTSLGIGRTKVRGCGQDAVRLVLGAPYRGRFKPIAESRRIYRTAPKGEHDERVAAFLERLKDAIRSFYKEALGVPGCPVCGTAMRLRENKKTSQKFYGCIQFPDCKGTLPANGRRDR
jgi:hypothetical protein